MKCAVCGSESEESAKFCVTCGAPLQAQAASQQVGQFDGGSASQPASHDSAAGQGVPQTASYAQSGSYGSGAPAFSPAPAPAPSSVPPTPKQGSSAPFVLAIIALVTAILGLFPVSLVLGIIALVMNRGQKKRGEVSTKQTPTFVMGLISLILSVLAAIVTVLLGGVIWLALMDDDLDLDLDHVTTSTESSQAASDESPVGVWAIVSMTDDGETYDEEYLKLMEDMGVSFDLVLAEDGTASLEFFGESELGSWENKGAGKVAITFDDDTLEGTVSGDDLTLPFDEGEMVLRRSSKEAPASAVSSSSKSESSSSSASSSASSSSASSSSKAKEKSSEKSSEKAKAADSYSTTDEPTLGEFSWYAGAGGIPSGATTLKKFEDVKGGWKAYVFGNGMDRLCNAKIGGSASSATITIDWRYVHNTDTDTGKEDDTPDETFEGDWDGSLGLEALGAGRFALTDFWQKGDHQYGMGSFMWPSGETDTVLLVRP